MLCLKAVVVFVEVLGCSWMGNLNYMKVPVWVVGVWFMVLDIKDLVIF
jgi:hypothetical protein